MIAVGVALCGTFLLVTIAALIGLTNARAERAAWQRLAQQRRDHNSRDRELIRAVGACGGAACRLLRERSDPYRKS